MPAPGSAPLSGVVFKDVAIASADTIFVIENAVDLRLENFRIGDQTIDGEFDWRKR